MSKVVLPFADADGDGDYAALSADNPLFVSLGTAADNNANFDLFARARVCNPETLFDGHFGATENQHRWKGQTSGSGATSAVDNTDNVWRLTTSAATVGAAVVQSRRYVTYQPAKTMLIIISFCLLPTGTGTGTLARAGYFDSSNGIFVESAAAAGNAKRIVIRRRGVDTAVAQSDWNYDKMDGTGVSGVTLDFTKQQIMFIQFKWLGSGNVYLGFVVENRPLPAHIFRHTNVFDVKPYWANASLPIRAELSNNGSDSARSLNVICCSAVSEGGYNPRGVVFSQPRSILCTDVDSGIDTAILALRLRSDASRAFSVNIKSLSTIVTSASANIYFSVWKIQSPTAGSLLTSGTWTDVSPYSAMQYNEYGSSGLQNPLTAGGFSSDGAVRIATIFGSTGNSSIDSNVQVLLNKDINGVSDYCLVTATALNSNNEAVSVALGWQELS